MTADPPKYRPLERFWPYAELPEQPTAAELTALDPDLYEALFGAQKRPFSISGDDLTFTTAVASIGGSNEVKWKRVK